MFNIFQANWYLAIGAALVFIVTAHIITRVWESHRSRSDGQHAIERLKNLRRGEPLKPEPTVKPGLPLHVVTEGQAVLDREEPLEREPQVKPELPLKVGTDVQMVLDREEPLEPEPEVRPGLPLKVGTKVHAIRNFRPVKEGAPGIITGIADVSFFGWSRPTYLCTFADNIKAHARPKQIEAFDHGHCLDELQQPDFGSILSRRLTLRAQSVLSQRRASRLGNAIIRG
jgi:hypothetical protein